MGEPPCFNLSADAARVLLALGSNVGDRLQNLRAAVAQIGRVLDVERVSRVYESAPVGYQEQPDFLNLVLRARTELEPLALFARLQEIERGLGRERSFRNAPRTIDIDILSYDDCVLSSEQLTIPHPRMLERAFVILPLLEVAPDFRHPVQQGQSIKELAATLPPANPRYSL